MWPDAVERVAAVVRNAGVHGRIEELAYDVETPPGPAAQAQAFDCDGRLVVALVPAGGAVARDRLGCTIVRAAPVAAFPYAGARVLLDRSLLAHRTVWLEAGSPRHFLGISPSQLARLTRAGTADLLQED